LPLGREAEDAKKRTGGKRKNRENRKKAKRGKKESLEIGGGRAAGEDNGRERRRSRKPRQKGPRE